MSRGVVALVAAIAATGCGERGTKPVASATPDIVTTRSSTPAKPSSSAVVATPAPSTSFMPRQPTEAELRDAPWVQMTADQRILVDGKEVARTGPVEAKAVGKIDGLHAELVARRRDYRSHHPDGDFPGVVLFDVDEAVLAVVVKSAFQTAALAGFPDALFRVKKKPEP